MVIEFEGSGSVEGLVSLLTKMENDNSIKGIMILACDENNFNAAELNPILKKFTKPLIGGIFPQILYKNEKYLKGSLVSGFTKPFSTSLIREISNSETDFEKEILTFFPDKSFSDNTVFVFVDGLSKRISALNESIFNCWGLQANYIGGGAGSLSFVQKPVIFSNEGLISDSAVFALAELKSGVGVSHGWTPISDSLKVTEVEENTVISLNWRPAFEVYRETVEKVSGKKFAENAFFDLAKGFPLGIAKVSNEMIVRDPISIDGEKLICVGEVPQNSFVSILTGNKESLIAGAEKALNLAEISFSEAIGKEKKESKSITFFIDCISRVLFLGDDFHEEQETVSKNDLLFGALTLGEIANTGKTFLEFYNKTSVVGLLED